MVRHSTFVWEEKEICEIFAAADSVNQAFIHPFKFAQSHDMPVTFYLGNKCSSFSALTKLLQVVPDSLSSYFPRHRAMALTDAFSFIINIIKLPSPSA